MTSRFVATLVTLTCLASASQALADCPVYVEMQETKAAYPKAVAAEKAGRLTEALALYVRAGERGAWCADEKEGENRHVKAAAERAAAIALPLAKAAEAKGQLEEAVRIYEQGAYLAHADRLLMTLVRANADAPGAVEGTLDVFRNREFLARSMPAGLAAAGPYTQDPALVAELRAMPAKGAERALAREATAFREQYLKDLVQLVQSRPEPKADIQSMMQSAARSAAGGTPDHAFAQKWPEDPLEASRDAIDTVYEWARIGTRTGAYHDETFRASAEARASERARQRATVLSTTYSGAPELLEAAKAYYGLAFARRGADSDAEAARADAERLRAIDQIKGQASALGDAAGNQGRFTLAIAYYSVAGAEAKRKAAQERQRQAALTQAQSDIDAARALTKTLSDPSAVAAMRQQAEAARAAIVAAQTQKPSDKEHAASASDLENELGLK